MKDSVEVTSYDAEAGLVSIRVSAVPDLYLAITGVEVAYRESGSEEDTVVELEVEDQSKKLYAGTLDISKWKGTDGELRITLKLQDGTVFSGAVVENMKELLD